MAGDHQVHNDRSVDPDAPRKKLVWEAALGFVGFFSVMAAVTAVWNVFRPEPAVLPSIVLLVLLALLAGTWKGYSRYR